MHKDMKGKYVQDSVGYDRRMNDLPFPPPEEKGWNSSSKSAKNYAWAIDTMGNEGNGEGREVGGRWHPLNASIKQELQLFWILFYYNYNYRAIWSTLFWIRHPLEDFAHTLFEG